MRYNEGIQRSGAPLVESSFDSNSKGVVEYGRVVDVVLDKSHPKFKNLGGTQALCGVFFQPLFTAEDEEVQPYVERFAYCGNSTFRQIPIKGEIVRLETKLSAVQSEENFKSDGNVYKIYWTEIVPLWNTPHLNAYPDIPNQSKSDYGKNFKESGDIKPLQLNAGDVTIEGRHGQSLRFGGSKSSDSPIAKSDTNGKPYTILRNGQAKASGDTCFEDIDKDDASLYLTSDHKVSITEANRKFRGAKAAPPLAKEYKGKQAVLNADRLLLNARNDNLILAAKKHASINADSTSIDGEQYVGLDATKVYLGSAAQMEMEPVLKGTATGQLLLDLGNALMSWCTQLSSGLATAAAINPLLSAPAGVTATAAGQFQGILNQGRIDLLKSKKVYTE